MKVFLLFLVLAVIGGAGCASEKQQEVPAQAVDFRLMDTDSVYRDLAHFKGRVIMLHFWADWCPHCRKEFPELENTYRNLHEKGLEIVGINSGQSFEHVTGIQQEFGLSFPLLVDESGETAKKYKVTGLPASIFVDSTGKILNRQTGWMTEAKITEIFAGLVAE